MQKNNNIPDRAAMAGTTAAVIVTFNGNWHTVGQLVQSCRDAGIAYVIVDNGSADPAPLKQFNTIFLRENMGIAAAQNAGIAHCLQAQAGVIVFFDQDSRIAEGFLARLVQPVVELGTRIAAPVFYDIEKGFSYPIVRILRSGVRTKFYPELIDGPLITNVAISSGTAVAADVFAIAGMMDESLFIDYVDTEWCLRCAARGITIRIDPAVRMEHSIGDRSMSIGRLKVPVHSPLRRYYRIRNSFQLLRMPHIPTVLALREIVFSIAHQLIIAATTKPRGAYMKYMTVGIWHGLRGRLGRY